MALQITQWDLIKKLLFTFDIIILLLNAALFSFTTYIIYTEYYSRATLKLFFMPFILSFINIIIDILMNKTNYQMKYAGHNRYGMLTRFFMFYFVIVIVIYADQRAKYIKEGEINIIKHFVIYVGIANIAFIIASMVLGFFVIDVQSFKQIWIKKRNKRKKTKIDLESVKEVNNIGLIDS